MYKKIECDGCEGRGWIIGNPYWGEEQYAHDSQDRPMACTGCNGKGFVCGDKIPDGEAARITAAYSAAMARGMTAIIQKIEAQVII